MTRLTSEIRDTILHNLLVHKFDTQLDQIIKWAKVASQGIYDEVYPAKIQKEMDKLPQGWLTETLSMEVVIGEEVNYITWGGGIYGVNLSPWPNADYPRSYVVHVNKKIDDYPPKRVLYKHSNGFSRTRPKLWKTNPAAKRYYDLRDKCEQWTRERDAAVKDALALLKSVGTVEALCKVWPEVAPLVPNVVDKKKNVPAIQTEKLNSSFGLPITEGAE